MKTALICRPYQQTTPWNVEMEELTCVQNVTNTEKDITPSLTWNFCLASLRYNGVSIWNKNIGKKHQISTSERAYTLPNVEALSKFTSRLLM